MKKLALTLAVLLASSIALAQPEGEHPGMKHDNKRHERMAKELNLTEEQMEQMREIRESGGSREDMQAVLTEEQRAKGKAMREQKAERMKAHLELTDEQVEQMREVHENGGGRDEIRAILTEEQLAKWDEQRARHDKKGGKGKGKPQPDTTED